MKRTWSILILAAFLAITYFVGGIGASVMRPERMEWYNALAKPEWTPPARWFGPVWLALYTLIAVAAWLVSRHGPAPQVLRAHVAFFIQLALNLFWPLTFFGLQRIGAAFFVLVFLWGAALITTVLFWRVRPLAGALMLPYLAWITFAGFLNAAIWRMN